MNTTDTKQMLLEQLNEIFSTLFRTGNEITLEGFQDAAENIVNALMEVNIAINKIKYGA